MARQFNGTNEALQSGAIDLTGANVLSLAWMMYWDTFADDDDLAFEFSNNVNSGAGRFIVNPNASGTVFQIAHRGDVGFSIANYTRPSNAVWLHYIAIFDISLAADEVDLYIEGALQTPISRPTNANNANTFRNDNLNFMSRNQASLFGAGRMAEVALYPIRLTSDEAAALGDRESPLKIRPESLLRYWPLGGVYDANDGDHDLIAGDTLTQTNAPTTADHPPGMKYPSKVMGHVEIEAAPPVGGILVHPGMTGGIPVLTGGMRG